MSKKWYRRPSFRYLLNALTFAAIIAILVCFKSEIISIWKGLSDSLKAGLIAGSVTLLVMWRNNANALSRHKLQLEHDREVKQQEREMAMRKEIFLGAIKSLAKAAGHIAAFARNDVTDKELAAFNDGILEAIYKIHMVAQLSTITALNKAHQIYAEAICELSITRQQLQSVQQTINDYQQRMDQRLAYGRALLDRLNEMKNKRLTVLEAEQLKAIDLDFRQNDHQLKHDIQKATEIKTKLHDQQFAFLERCNFISGEYGHALLHANLSIREELNMRLDPELYIQEMEKEREKARKTIARFVAALRESSYGSAAQSQQATLKTDVQQQ